MRRTRCLAAVLQTTPASTPSPQHLQRPYEVEGGAVPIYQMTNGRISKRHWVYRNPAWCDLCKEPVSLWANHHGRKDHALLDLHYSSMVEFPRNWCPEQLLILFQHYIPHIPIEAYQRHYAHYDQERRDEIFSLIKFLEEEKVLYLGENRQTFLARMLGGLRGMDHQGALVMHQQLLGPMMKMHPEGGIQDFSNLLDFITCAYNMETVYDLCGFQALDRLAQQGTIKMGVSSPAAMGLGGIATSSTAASGYTAQGKPDPSLLLSEQEYEEAFSRKAVFIRSVLGQLRWATVEDQVHPTGRVYPHHIVLCCQLLIKALVTEVIAARICEYMVRVEPVWREFGLERKKLKKQDIMTREITPGNVRYCYRPMSYSGDDLYDVTPPPKSHK